MARPLRIEYPGAVYHVTSRGDRKENIYLSDKDKQNFLTLLDKVCERHSWYCHAYCLMSNHYHLLLETPNANLSKGMQYLNGVYTQHFNKIYNHVGHVFQGRFKAILVEKNSYLLELARYIVLNPVRANLVSTPSEWKWSSYLATCGEAKIPPWLTVSWLQEFFKNSASGSIEKYKQFVNDGLNVSSPWKKIKNQIYLGSDRFVSEMTHNIKLDLHALAIETSKPAPISILSQIEKQALNRNQAIRIAYETGKFTLKELGDYFNLHDSRISKIVKTEANKRQVSDP
ncbi:transposase [Legionella nagasakiensis]|uniref:transposase n=1 Tax=Legionella nagasakiensis TaxID=535290 RepID=UPI0010545268|nr:transposase [Legionella nagasakiensis]